MVVASGGDNLVEWVRVDWTAGGAVVGVAKAACRLACCEEGRQGDADLDDSAANDGPAKRPLSGENRNLPRHCDGAQAMRNAGGRTGAACGLWGNEEIDHEEADSDFC